MDLLLSEEELIIFLERRWKGDSVFSVLGTVNNNIFDTLFKICHIICTVPDLLHQIHDKCMPVISMLVFIL